MSGASVLTASSPAEALSIMAQRVVNDVGVDLAVVDYRLPGMNGCVLADDLRARHPD
jgi:CheY-like chemotaxis protein